MANASRLVHPIPSCPGRSALTLEYKYVVCDKHGAPVRWKEGSNLAVNVPLVADAGLRAESVVVRDAWDGSLQVLLAAT